MVYGLWVREYALFMVYQFRCFGFWMLTFYYIDSGLLIRVYGLVCLPFAFNRVMFFVGLWACV